jgi:hypothetical protein
LRVRIPVDLQSEVERVAAERGVDPAIAAGDLVADALPDALAEAARERLSDNCVSSPETDDDPGNPRVVSEIGQSTSTLHRSLPAAQRRAGPGQVDSGGATN